MSHYGFRFLIAIVTFTVGLTISWALRSEVLSRPDLQIDSVSIPLDRVNDTNEVYRVILEKGFGSETKLTVVQAETASYKVYDFELKQTASGETESVQQMIKRMMPEAELQTLDDYIDENRTSGPLQVSNLGPNYVLATSSDLAGDNLDTFWGRFHKKYGDSSNLAFFSKVGFNATHDQAFVYVGHTCGGLCGSGGFVLLRKLAGKWVIQQEEGLWIS